MKKKIIIAITLVLIAFGAYKGTLAIFHQETNIDAPISAGKLGIEIINSSTKESVNAVSFENVMPGMIVDDKVSIFNAKDKDLYLRVTLTRYWTDQKDKKVTDANAEFINPITKDTSNWIIRKDTGNANNEILYFYYKLPIAAKETTSNLLDQIGFDSNISDRAYSSYKANVLLEAEAVQMIGAQDAMVSQWGVEATLDDKGNITSILE